MNDLLQADKQFKEDNKKKVTSKVGKDFKKHYSPQRVARPSAEWRTDGSQESLEREMRRREKQMRDYHRKGTVNPNWWG